ncbi:hypothetical protein A8C75_11910 [Marinobacterium aestuarii]|uniref:Uncharacterized protein n=1 Tax=Marinobacterium aestuarii TaxID=1821621 RepID=A0A1A9EZP6_9GAMM|nr:hypothetical protein [Marinobacterium aestuarii]ANG63108.1 hypothetical protein A8C75_11910 [Marinobacterium aestuarii]
MDASLLETLGKVAGVGGISLGVVTLIFRDVIRKNIFPSLTKVQAYKVIQQIVWLTFLVAAIGLASWVYIETRTVKPVITEEAKPKIGQFALNMSKSSFRETLSAKFAASEIKLPTYGVDPAFFGVINNFRAIFSVSIENVNERDLLVTDVIYDVSEIGQVMSGGAGPLNSNQTYFHEIKYEVGQQKKQLVPPYRIPAKSVGAFELELYSTDPRPGLTWIMNVTFVTNMGEVSTDTFQLILTGKNTDG